MKKISYFYKYLLYRFKKKKNLDKLIIEYDNLNDLFNYFGSDKGTYIKNPYNKKSDFIKGHGFAKYYELHLENLKQKKFNLLEIGTWKGASAASFCKYFQNANIVSIDRNFKIQFSSSRLYFYNCNTTKTEEVLSLVKILNKKNFNKFDIIIDDGSHLLSDIIKNFVFFFKFLNPGGFYIIEDYNHPKYFDYLKDTSLNEPFIDEILFHLEKKKNFNSAHFIRDEQNKLFNDINKIFKYKGDMLANGKNISDLAFIQKVNN